MCSPTQLQASFFNSDTLAARVFSALDLAAVTATGRGDTMIFRPDPDSTALSDLNDDVIQVKRILDLPQELLDEVFSYLDVLDICSSTRVCRLFLDLAEPYLYRNVVILEGGQAAALVNAFHQNPTRVRWVRSLLVSTKFGDDEGLQTLPPWIIEMDNLRHIRLETPDCNLKDPEDRINWIQLQDRYERVLEQASILVPLEQRRLRHLQTCTVHLVDERREMITMSRHSALFLHPNLRSLTISCASTDFVHHLPLPLTRDLSLTRSTRLEHLHLEECDIHCPSLMKLLRLSRELKSLKISEGVRYDHDFFSGGPRMHGNVTPDALVETIARYCSKSLTDLSLSLGHLRFAHQSITQRGQHLNLTIFDNLKRLELDMRTFHLVQMLPFCDHLTYRRLPASLKTLRVFGLPLLPRSRPFRLTDDILIPVKECLIQDKVKHGVPNLETVIFSYEYSDTDGQSSIASEDGETIERVPRILLAQVRVERACVKLRPRYRKSNIRLLIEMTTLPSGFIPPYLYPEESPSSEIFWDSTATPGSTSRFHGIF